MSKPHRAGKNEFPKTESLVLPVHFNFSKIFRQFGGGGVEEEEIQSGNVAVLCCICFLISFINGLIYIVVIKLGLNITSVIQKIQSI
jgi:hypothetical protein